MTVAPCRRPACDPGCVGPGGPRRSATRQALRAAAAGLAAVTGAGLVVVVGAVPGHHRVHRSVWALRQASRWTLRGLGVRLETVGRPRSGPSLVVGNHVSFLDILGLAAAAPLRQVAKQEVAGWPLIGGLARRTGTLFVRRNRPRELPALVDAMVRALRAGHRVQVFPEGTTRCGSSLGRFHRSVFQAALDAAVVITPVALSYTVAGQPTRQPAFLGDESLVVALRRVLAQPGLTLRLRWLPAIPAIAGTGHAATDRRRVAQLAESCLARALAQPVVVPRAQPSDEPRVLLPR